MTLSLTQSTAPTVEPVTLQMAKDHLRVNFDKDNEYISQIVKASRRAYELATDRQLINASWTYQLDNFPATGTIILPKSPLSSVTSVKYYDTSSTQQTVATSVYDSDANRIRPIIFLKYNQTWPSDVRGHTNDVEVIFVAGYGATTYAVPETHKVAILQLVAQWYEHREPVVMGNIPAPVEKTLDWLIDLERVPIVA